MTLSVILKSVKKREQIAQEGKIAVITMNAILLLTGGENETVSRDGNV